MATLLKKPQQDVPQLDFIELELLLHQEMLKILKKVKLFIFYNFFLLFFIIIFYFIFLFFFLNLIIILFSFLFSLFSFSFTQIKK